MKSKWSLQDRGENQSSLYADKVGTSQSDNKVNCSPKSLKITVGLRQMLRLQKRHVEGQMRTGRRADEWQWVSA